MVTVRDRQRRRPKRRVRLRSLTQGAYRRSLVTGIASSAAVNVVENFAYSHDDLGRPISRNTATFGYNERGAVTAANVAAVPFAYGYDDIGNSTNWSANCLNQYTFVSGGPTSVSAACDADGNMTTNIPNLSIFVYHGSIVGRSTFSDY